MGYGLKYTMYTTEVLWRHYLCHGNPMEAPWKSDGTSTGEPLTPWELRGTPMDAPQTPCELIEAL